MPVNILQLISSFGFFGAENVLVQLSLELQAQPSYNPIVGVIKNSHNPHTEVAEECRRMGIETQIFDCAGKIDPQTIFNLRRFIQQRNIAITHSHGYKSNLYSFFASRFLSTALVSTCHNWIEDDAKLKLYSLLDRFMLKRFHNIVAVSEDVLQKLLASGIKPEKTAIINNGVSLKRFSAPKSKDILAGKLGISKDTVVVGTVGRLSQEKGHRYLLSTAAAIVSKYPKSVFLIIGDGPLKTELEKEFGSASVIFTGSSNDVSEWYRAMDLFVLPSLTEGLPMALLEAVASKVPVIASRVGAIPSLIIDGETGMLIEPGDVNSLKQALEYMLEHRAQAERLSEQAYQRICSKYSAVKMAEQYMNIYRKVAAA